MAVAAELLPDVDIERSVNRGELAVVVRYEANSARENAEGTENYETLFSSAVALSGLEMLKDNKSGAIRHIKDACTLPSATRFNLLILKDRLEQLRPLKFQAAIVSASIKTVDVALGSMRFLRKWEKVVVFHG
jgi:hypothetical protein